MALGFMNEALPWLTSATSGPNVLPKSGDDRMHRAFGPLIGGQAVGTVL
jgi:hypothetical protein